MTPRFRVNPEVEIVPWHELHAGEQEQLRRLTGQSAVPAILRPKPGARGTIKMVDEDFLRLLDSLRTPSAVPGCAALCGMPRFLKLSVLDGILEVEIGGQFVGGPAAAGLVKDAAFENLPADRIAELSLEALQYAAALPVMEARALSSRLYGYNSIPCSTKWKSALGTPENIADLLGLGIRGQNFQALVEQGYDAVEHPQWLAWTRRTDWEAGLRAGIKLYISPQPECLLTAFSRAIPVLIRSGVLSVKIGRTAQNLLRSDKCVVYLASEAALQRILPELRHALRGFPAHGVPFTSALTDDGMLSWGADPPRSLCLAGWAQAESWRAWITNRLAIGLLQSKAQSPSDAEPWKFALTKLAVEGVDVRRWSPQPALWTEE